MKLSVLIPTLTERAEQLARTAHAYRETAPGCEILATDVHQSVFRGWGAGCNQLATVAKGDVLLFASDDALPRPGWLEAGLEALERGVMPRARLLEDGKPGNPNFDDAVDWTPLDFSPFIFLPRDVFLEVGPVKDSTWYVDVEYCARLRAHGWPTVARKGFDFDHLRFARRWYRVEDEHRYQRAAGIR